VTEIYGISTGIGIPLSEDDLAERAFYWEIKENKCRRHVVLTYMEPYHQMELMSEYSTAYNMNLFEDSARIFVTSMA